MIKIIETRNLMEQMTLHNVEKACGGHLYLPDEASKTQVTSETLIQSAILDSRKITEGALFFATVGERVDGHKFIASAYSQGACCVITEKTPEMVEGEHGIPAKKWGAYILVENSFQALKDIAEFYRSTLTIPIVGITGSVGKTSTKEFIASVLSEKYKVLKTEGNFNNEIGLPLTLLRISKQHEVAVVEMGISDFGEMHRLSKMARPNICVITNIGQCHLENLKDRDGILKAKTEIFDYMPEDGEVCLNGEDDKLATVTSVHGKKTHFFGLSEDSIEEVFATNIQNNGLFGSKATLHMPNEQREIAVPLPGSHMVINATAAACVAGLLGLTGEEIEKGIAKVTPVGGRSNLIQLEDYVLIDDCYNANPVSMKSAIDLLQMAKTPKTAILGDMFELGPDSDTMHAQIGTYAINSGMESLICIGENSKHMYEAALQVKSESQAVSYFPTKEEFLSALEAEGKTFFTKDSTVLVKASNGMGFAEIIENIRSYF